MNGDDDDLSATMGGTDWGGGMYDTPDPMPPPTEDDDDGNRLNRRRTQRRHPRPKFRVERKARRTPR